jgi:hypothetical protein
MEGSSPDRLAIEQLGRSVGEVLGVFAKTDIKKTILPGSRSWAVPRPWSVRSVEDRRQQQSLE